MKTADTLTDKNKAAAEMVRVIRHLQDKLEELGGFTPEDHNRVSNAIYTFLATQPKKVADDVREG